MKVNGAQGRKRVESVLEHLHTAISPKSEVHANHRQYDNELQRASFIGRESKPDRLTLEGSAFEDYSFICVGIYLFEQARVKEIRIYTPTVGAGMQLFFYDHLWIFQLLPGR